VLSKSVKAAVRSGLEFINTYSYESKVALAVIRQEQRAAPLSVVPQRQHLDAAMSWIMRAQDADSTGGVPWGFRARRPVRTAHSMGWIAPYPETTGYIIPTMLGYADLTGDREILERARRMADWEMSIQLDDGGFQGGLYGSQPVESSTFVTGQVLFGLVSMFERFGDDRLRKAATRAGDWLLGCLDTSGRFVRGYSHFCAPGAKAYEVRTGLALAKLADVLGNKEYREAAGRIADHALSVQQPNGWFAENDLDFHDRPLTHTIGYALEGLHGIGVHLSRNDCIDAVERALRAIVPLIKPNGWLAGRLHKDWTPATDSVCLTGSAQIAGVFLRRYLQTDTRDYFEAGRKLLGFVCFTQDLRTGIAPIDGGIRGSYPFGGEYGQWCVLNWATKFFADSLMDYFAAEDKRRQQASTAQPSHEAFC
jgi:rhamnogalacturonyl hydrolase YesR